MDTDLPLFFSEIQYLLLETIPLENIMRVCLIAITNFKYSLHLVLRSASVTGVEIPKPKG